MFKLIFVKDEQYFAIQDTSDGSIDICVEPQIMNFLRVGIEIGGIQPAFEQGTFSYDDTYFVEMAEESDDEDTDEDDDYFSSDDYDDEYDDFSAEADEETDEEESESSEDEYEDDDEYGDFSSEVDEESEVEEEADVWDDYDDSEDDFYVADGEEQSYVDRLYSMLTEQQKDVLKRYYLWSSQILFEGAPTKGSLQITKKVSKRELDKQHKLDNLRNQGQDWVYAGFIDLGYHGAGHCTFGHALRYEHFAWDVSAANLDEDFWGADMESVNWDRINALIDSGHVIKFGIDCIGDFFDVPKEVLSAIKSVQAKSLAEMEQMCKILLNSMVAQNVKNSFGVFEMLADQVLAEESRSKLLGKKDKGNYALMMFYKEFKKYGMIYPRSLVKRVQDVFLSRKSHKYLNNGKSRYSGGLSVTTLNADVIKRNLNRIKGVDTQALAKVAGESPLRSYASIGRLYLENLFFIQSAGIYGYNPYSEIARDRDEGGNSEVARRFFNRITGTTDSDANDILEVMKTYQGYPMLFNQCFGSGFRAVGGFDDIGFTKEYIGKVNELQSIIDKAKAVAVSFEESKLPKVVLRNGVYERSDTDTYARYELKQFMRKFNPDKEFWTGYDTIRIGAGVGISTIQDVCNCLNQKVADLEQGIQVTLAKIKEQDDKIIAESIAKYNERHPDKPFKAEPEQSNATSESSPVEPAAVSDTEPQEPAKTEVAKSEPVKSEPVKAESEQGSSISNEATSTSTSSQTDSQEGLASIETEKSSSGRSTLKGAYERCKAGVSKLGLDKFKPDDEEDIVSSVIYAVNAINGVSSQLDAVNPVICKICNTMRTKGGTPSSKQLYFLKLGFKEIMKQFDSSAEVKKMNVDTVEKFKLFEHPDIKQDVDTLFLRLSDLKNMNWNNDNVTKFRVCNAIMNAHRLGYATKKQLEYFEKAKSMLNSAQ